MFCNQINNYRNRIWKLHPKYEIIQLLVIVMCSKAAQTNKSTYTTKVIPYDNEMTMK